MKRLAWTLAAILPLAAASVWFLGGTDASAQDVALEVKGDVKIVVVVNSLPATIHAPANAGLHFWSYPSAIEAVDKGDRLEILKAPKGTYVVSVKLIIADWDAKKFITKFGQVTFVVGEPGPGPTPPPPPPPPQPETELEKSVRLAWEGEPDKSVYSKAILAQIHKQAAEKEVNDPALKTFGELYLRLSKAADSLLPKTALSKVRTAIADELKKVLPVEPSAPLHVDARRIAASQFAAVAVALEKLK